MVFSAIGRYCYGLTLRDEEDKQELTSADARMAIWRVRALGRRASRVSSGFPYRSWGAPEVAVAVDAPEAECLDAVVRSPWLLVVDSTEEAQYFPNPLRVLMVVVRLCPDFQAGPRSRALRLELIVLR